MRKALPAIRDVGVASPTPVHTSDPRLEFFPNIYNEDWFILCHPGDGWRVSTWLSARLSTRSSTTAIVRGLLVVEEPGSERHSRGVARSRPR